MLTVDKVKKDYNSFKAISKRLILKGKYNDAEDFISAASRIAYNFNFIYADKELDLMLNQISDVYIEGKCFGKIDDRYVFFDSFGYDNRGLTQQYIRALISWDVEFLYILEYENTQCETILNELKKHKKAKIHILSDTKIHEDKAQEIYDLIADFKADKAFLHLAPWSSTAIISWAALSSVTRYLIDLTDHAFWLGSECFDYYISFRDYGSYISERFRGITKDKQILMPFYPIVEGGSEFQGFEPDISNKKVIFTGGSYYKMYGKGDVFLNILKRICLDNYDTVILIAGSGDARILENFIKKNRLDEQVFLIGSRKDIVGVFKNIDIYLNTYPVGGGLMSQLAVSQHKPLIGYCTNDMPMSFPESLFRNTDDTKFTYNDLELFHEEMNKLLSSDSHLKKTVIKYGELNISPSDFSSELQYKIKNTVTITDSVDFPEFCNENVVSLYLCIENEYLKSYERTKLASLRFKYAKYDFIGFVRTSLSFWMTTLMDRLNRGGK